MAGVHPAVFPFRQRSAALERLAAFVPNAGRRYAAERNHDRGPAGRENVSMLSPNLRYRVLTEREVLAAVLQQHSPTAAEKFIQEVFWRTYWKGWLQMRPQIWHAFLQERDAERARLAQTAALHADWIRAEAGRTGIAGFDDWVQELVETGYLHNHARMWFASIWIFTLRLPWSLGADFFLRHLLDADPASNTLGWRWVAGIQTPGKTYLARADNIEQYTGGRYRPQGLASTAPPIREETLPPPVRLPPAAPLPAQGSALLLLLHAEDFAAHELIPPGTDIRSIVVVTAGHPQYPWPFGAQARQFVADIATDTATRLTRDGGWPRVHVLDGLHATALRQHCIAADVSVIVTTEAPIGPIADGLRQLTCELAQDGIALITLRRPWDALAWPHATHGFFRFRQQIPELLLRNGIGS